MEARIQRRLGLCDPGMTAIDTMSLAPLLDLDFTQGRHYAHRSIMGSALTFTRASAALDYAVQPAVLRATNIPRYMQNSAVNALNGILIEGADTNLCIRNEYSSFLLADWLTTGATITASTDVNLYNGGAIKCVVGAGNTVDQIVTLTAVKYIVSALVYKNGTQPTNNDFQLAADIVPFPPASLTTTWEHLGGGVYLAWAVFTGTAVPWLVGFNSTGGITCYISCLTCHIAAPANEGGDFPRSPIPNTTGASITRAADVLTIPGTGNIGLAAGTIDAEFVAPCAETTATAYIRIWDIYKDASNFVSLCYNTTGDTLDFFHRIGGVGATKEAAASVPLVRGNIVKARCVYGTDISGSKDLIIYVSVNAGAWSELASNDGPLGGAIPAGTTINIGRYGGASAYFGSLVRRFRCFNYAKLGLPGDF